MTELFIKTYVLYKVKLPSEIYYYKSLFIFTVASIMAANMQTNKKKPTSQN